MHRGKRGKQLIRANATLVDAAARPRGSPVRPFPV
jgi:hypothetical protein